MKRLLPFLLLLSLLGCDSSETAGNHAPVIQEIIIDDPSVTVNQDVIVTAIATDEDGDPITYYWSASEGEIISYGNYGPTTNPSRWRAPDVLGTYSITCTVSDGLATSSASVSVTVAQPS